MNWTDDQGNAIKSKGNTIVTAAAGSGKTAVLVERVVSRLCDKDDKLSADKLLIVTFTNAAAAEMRQRIEKALADKAVAEPNNQHVLEQRLLIPTADICTIDSFCIRLVRNNFTRLSVSPDFKIADKVTDERIKERAIKRIFKRKLTEQNAEFISLLKLLNSEYGTENTEKFIKELVDVSYRIPNSKKWIEGVAEAYNPDKINSSPWILKHISSFIFEAEEIVKNLGECLPVMLADESISLKYGTFYNKAYEFMKEILPLFKELDWDKIYNALQTPIEIVPQFRSSKACDADRTLLAKEGYMPFKDFYKKILKEFDRPLCKYKADFEFNYAILNQIKAIAYEYMDEYRAELNNKSLLTFALTEQLTLELLTSVDEDGNLCPSDISKEIADSYEEVLVDEYQDVNNLQGMIFHILSRGSSRLFTVGDIKQSIYGFRGSNPDIFSKRSETAIMYDENISPEISKRVVLSKNFRSRNDICGFINEFFGFVMHKESGGVQYDDNEMLKPSDSFPENGLPAVEAHIIDCNDELGEITTEAEYLADYVLKTLQQPAFLRDGKEKTSGLRRAQYGDFAILFRSATNLHVYINALKKRNIPVSIGLGDLFGTTEIMTFVSLLKAIESPLNDLAMLSVMLSPIFGFSEEDVASIKNESKGGRLFLSVCRSSEEKCKYLAERFSIWRKQAAGLSVSDFVSFLLKDSGYSYMVLAMSDAERRVANLSLLENIAEEYFSESGGDLGGFIGHLNYLEKSGKTESAVTPSDNSVLVTSMHKSKGLQFPITIIIGCGTKFNEQEKLYDVLFDDELGVSFNYLDDENNVKDNSITRKIILKAIDKKRVDEEMRLLYVAMTRAEERLVLLLGSDDFASSVQGYADFIKNNVTADGMTLLASQAAKSFAYWLVPALLMTPSGRSLIDEYSDGKLPFISNGLSTLKNEVKVFYGNINDIKFNENPNSNESLPEASAAIREISDIFAYEYPYKELNSIEIKTSVSDLTKRGAEREFCACSRPAFLSEKGLSPTERGTAMHKLMQYADFNKLAEDMDSELERLYEFEFISRAELEAIDKDKVADFIRDDLFGRILKATALYREQRFLTDVRAGDIYSDLPEYVAEQKVILQGAVDCMFVENGEIVLIDFKTDRTRDEEFLLTHYSEQLKQYCIAAEKMLSLPVKECYIYSLYMGKTIAVK